ncbi:MAG: ParB/RepB/Spo0J family partition protein [Acidobacteria bacterium]|nr:ParB/RepB/Spo0J family partition protein [Acidobacteriota bacterium]
MSRKALGRGLSALIADEPEKHSNSNFLELDIDLVQPNTEQPRKSFPEKELEELTQSIRANGIVQPIVVRRQGKQYQIVAGERRWRAAQRAGLAKVPAVIREVTDEKLLELALIENIQRQELNPIEEALAYKKLIDTLGLTQETVASQVGKTRTFITNYLRLLRLPKKITSYVEDGTLSVGHARALLALEDKNSQLELAARIIKSSLSVRQTESAVKKFGAESPRNSEKKNKIAPKDPNIAKAETKLRRVYGTQVKIVPGAKGENGRIELEYYGEADLDRIYKLLITK